MTVHTCGDLHDDPIYHSVHYSDFELSSPCPILIIPSSRVGCEKYQFNKSLASLVREPDSQSPAREARAVPIQRPFAIPAMHGI